MSRPRRSIRLVVAHDHPLVLGGIAELLRVEKGFSVEESCRDGEACVDAIRRRQPDVAMVNVNMPGLTGLDVLERVAAEQLPTRVILLASALTENEIAAAIAKGVGGIVIEQNAAETLIECLRKVAEGDTCVPAELVARASERTSKLNGSAELTRSEAEIASALARGEHARQIASRRGVSVTTVRSQIRSIYAKLGVSSQVELMAKVRTAAKNT